MENNNKKTIKTIKNLRKKCVLPEVVSEDTKELDKDFNSFIDNVLNMLEE